MFTIAQVRRATEALRAEHTKITITNLASKLDCPRHRVEYFIGKVGDLPRELGVVIEGRFSGLVFAHAGDCIKLRGEIVTYESLARELNKSVKAVGMAFCRHPEWMRILGVMTAAEAKREARKRNYEVAIIGLRSRNRPVTQAAIARVCGVEEWRIHRDLKGDLRLRGFLKPRRQGN